MVLRAVWVCPVPGGLLTTSESPAADGVDDVLLVRVGVEQQKLLGRVPLVRAGEPARARAWERRPAPPEPARASAVTRGLFWLIHGSSRLPERSANVETRRLCSTSAPWIGWIRVPRRSRTGWGS